MYTFFVLQEANFTLCFVFKAFVSCALIFMCLIVYKKINCHRAFKLTLQELNSLICLFQKYTGSFILRKKNCFHYFEISVT